ncbi:MAG: hypothetical protein HFI38_13195 [Lachnospiraceae bacterium]|nr:hypothetical protein [Lachnospiraceae bacterium]
MSTVTLINEIIKAYSKRYDPYKKYAKIVRSIDLDKENTESKGNILITIIGGAYGHLFEGLYTRKAAINGYTPYILRCGNYLKYCDANPVELKHRGIRCIQCQAQQENFISAFGGVDCPYKDYIDSKDVRLVNSSVEDYFNKGLRVFLDVDIEKILYSALQRFYLIAEPEIKNDRVTRGFLSTIFSTLIVMDKLCKKINPKYVMSSHGTYSTWGAVVEYCKAHNVYVITYGQNYNHCGLEFTYDDSYLTGVLNDTENKWAEKILTEQEIGRVKRFLDERLGRISDEKVAFDYNKNNKAHYDRRQICDMIGIDPGKKLIGVFPNIPWDGQVTGGSTVFPRYREWLHYTVEYFRRRSDVALIFRSHPAEVNIGTDAGRETTESIIRELYSVIPENVYILDPRNKINSYTLGENCNFGIAYSSTVSLELTYLGVPVILCGCPPFKDKNVVFDITCVDDYNRLLDCGVKGELVVTKERKDRLFKYLHYFFFMRTMPQTLVDIKDTIPRGYLITNEDEMNKDPVFDDMFNKITNKEPMDFSRFYE